MPSEEDPSPPPSLFFLSSLLNFLKAGPSPSRRTSALPHTPFLPPPHPTPILILPYEPRSSSSFTSLTFRKLVCSTASCPSSSSSSAFAHPSFLFLSHAPFLPNAHHFDPRTLPLPSSHTVSQRYHPRLHLLLLPPRSTTSSPPPSSNSSSSRTLYDYRRNVPPFSNLPSPSSQLSYHHHHHPQLYDGKNTLHLFLRRRRRIQLGSSPTRRRRSHPSQLASKRKMEHERISFFFVELELSRTTTTTRPRIGSRHQDRRMEEGSRSSSPSSPSPSPNPFPLLPLLNAYIPSPSYTLLLPLKELLPRFNNNDYVFFSWFVWRRRRGDKNDSSSSS